MRLLFAVHQFFPRHYTGSERLTLDLSKQMQRMGHSVTVLTYCLGEEEGLESNGDFLIKRYQYQGVPVISVKHRKPPEGLDFVVHDESMGRMLQTVLPLDKLDVIHIIHPMRVGGTVGMIGMARKLPFVITLTDFWLMCPKGIAVTRDAEICLSSEGGVKCIEQCYGASWRERIEHRRTQTEDLLAGAAVVVSATSSMKQVFERGCLASAIRRIPFGEVYDNIVPNSRRYSAGSEITIGFMSTLTPHKGAHVLLEGYNLARQRNIALRIYGDHFGRADYFSTLKKLAGNNRKVQFCGAYNFEDMTRIYNEIDMLVLPSTWWENSPLVLSRALAHRVPAIVSNLGGMTEAVKDGENGFSFEVSDPESLAQVLRRIGDDPTVLNQLKKNIRRPPRMEEQAFEYDKLYRALLAGN